MRRRRKFRRFLPLIAFIVLAMVAAFFQFGLSTLPGHQPRQGAYFSVICNGRTVLLDQWSGPTNATMPMRHVALESSGSSAGCS